MNLFLHRFLMRRAGTGHIDHAQQREHQSLDKAGEDIEVTRQNRKNDKTSPPLVDSGQLANSIAYEVKEL